MTASARAAVVFRRAGLLAAVLALVAGIFGMHVMTADHSAHGAGSVGHPVQAAGADDPAGAAASAGHLAGHTAVGHHSHGTSGPEPLAAGACGGSCQGADEPRASCTPSAQAGSLTVLPPRAAPAIQPAAALTGGPGAATARAPATPTPCELSISRT